MVFPWKLPFNTMMAISSNLFSFANNIHTYEGGTHESGFKTALTRVINDYARKNNIFKENDTNFSGDDVREGLTAIISIKHPDPQFEGQTKTKLGNSEARTISDPILSERLGFLFMKIHQWQKKLLKKALWLLEHGWLQKKHVN